MACDWTIIWVFQRQNWPALSSDEVGYIKKEGWLVIQDDTNASYIVRYGVFNRLMILKHRCLHHIGLYMLYITIHCLNKMYQWNLILTLSNQLYFCSYINFLPILNYINMSSFYDRLFMKVMLHELAWWVYKVWWTPSNNLGIISSIQITIPIHADFLL